MKLRLILVVGTMLLIFGGVVGLFLFIAGDTQPLRQITRSTSEEEPETTEVATANETLGEVDEPDNEIIFENLGFSLAPSDDWIEASTLDVQTVRFEKENAFIEVGLNSNRDLELLQHDIYLKHWPTSNGLGITIDSSERIDCTTSDDERCDNPDEDERIHFLVTQDERAATSLKDGAVLYVLGELSDAGESYEDELSDMLELAETFKLLPS